MKIVLASKSPRRIEGMKQIVSSFLVVPAVQDEILDSALPLDEGIVQLAYQKAKEVQQKYPDALIVGMDTMVVLNNQPLGKPKDEEDAYRMLQQLSGTTHEILTGAIILYKGRCWKTVERNVVTFHTLKHKQIIDYISTKDPLDKAGAYGIQTIGEQFVKSMEGDMHNAMGFAYQFVKTTIEEIEKMEHML